MSDSVRMVDTVALSKSLDSLRRFDPEHRANTQRLASEAAAHLVEERHQDVEESEETPEARLDDREHGKGGRKQQERADDEDEASTPPEPVPEQQEGHLLNLKV